MIGGELSFQGGSYSRTPIEEILPVSFKDTAIRFIDKEYLPKINEDFFNHPILRLEKDLQLNQEVWDTLPPLQGANLGLVASNNAHVLVNFQNDKGNSFPILVAGNFGKGRTALLGTCLLYTSDAADE